MEEHNTESDATDSSHVHKNQIEGKGKTGVCSTVRSNLTYIDSGKAWFAIRIDHNFIDSEKNLRFFFARNISRESFIKGKLEPMIESFPSRARNQICKYYSPMEPLSVPFPQMVCFGSNFIESSQNRGSLAHGHSFSTARSSCVVCNYKTRVKYTLTTRMRSMASKCCVKQRYITRHNCNGKQSIWFCLR